MSTITEATALTLDVATVTRQIQANCDIADAGSGSVFSLCGFLLRLRDHYKWEHGFNPWEEPEPSDLLEWVEAREEKWLELGDETFQPLVVEGNVYQPFDLDPINDCLRPQGLVYGAGYVAGMKPSFLLAKIVESRSVGSLTMDTVDRELARDLFVTPAMRQGNRILARRSAMLFFIWDQILEMRPSAASALRYALHQYGLDLGALRRSPKELGPRLHEVAAAELAAWIYHEIGEAREDTFGGTLWQEMVATYANSPVEILARVLKDLLADTHPDGLLAHIIGSGLKSSLGFYVAFLRSFSRTVFPEIREAFEQFVPDSDWSIVEQARVRGRGRVIEMVDSLIAIHETGRDRGTDWARDEIIAALIEPLGIPSASRGIH
ncbi:MAG TPA: hypothetical protein DCZ69_09295 [Syntrophobacteraceae bacterium]|nr:hypothetical protein [Syntrophobacteraceae bacterium]